MSKDPPQYELVLAVLRQRGDRGLHSHEIRGLYIANPSERIRELEALGHVISKGKRERLNGKAYGKRYRLVMDADRPATGDGQLRLGDAA